MPTPEMLKAPFMPNSFYHIVCKSIDGISLFYNEGDYDVYRERFKKFISPFADVWSYSLLINHTHYICKLKSKERICLFIENLPTEERTKSMLRWTGDKENDQLFDEMMERQMNRFLVSYANYINNRYNRKGNLFQSPFKRLQIKDEGYLYQAIVYVHANALKHKIVEDLKKHFHNSYHNIIDNDSYYVDVNNVLDFFRGKERFIQAHEEQVAYFYSKGWPSSKLE